MRARLMAVLLGTLIVPLSLVHAEETLPQQFLAIYVKMHDSENLEKKQDFIGALKGFQECYDEFAAIHQSDPDWETALIIHRMGDCNVTIQRLQFEVTKLSTASSPPNAVASTTGTSTATDTAFKTAIFSRKTKLVYPWKTGILTTMFWIGEKSVKASAWNENWTASNHGQDTPIDRNGYAAGDHASSVNPFYVALPFNDLAFPAKAQQYVPASWQRAPKDGKPVSACKDRWVEIKTEDGTGRVCYAQWEDVGPGRNDHAEYVFGPEKPGPGDRAGLSASPAVVQYLGLTDTGSRTRWRFVDVEDVPPGMWLKLDEQAVIYTAMHQIKDTDSSSSPAIPSEVAPVNGKP